jgi:flagellar biosynthesis protein FlhG
MEDLKTKIPFVVTICSGKGGVGKSVLTSNIAYSLAQLGFKVLIWDANTNFPNQHLIIGVEPPVRLSEVYLGKVSLEQAIYSINENLDLLADTPAAGNRTFSETSNLISVYENILSDTNYDFVLIDTPAGGSDEVLQCCNFADLVSIVVTDEPTSLLDAYGLIKLLLPIIDKDYINLLVNDVIDYEDADEITHKLNLATRKFLGVEFNVLGFVSYDRMVRQSILKQQLFTISEPNSEVSKSVEKIAKNIEEKSNIDVLLNN